MLLLHLGIPPSGHGYAPPIAVAKITVLAKKGLYSAELHLRVYYSSRQRLSKKLSVNGEKIVLASQPDRRKHGTSPELSQGTAWFPEYFFTKRKRRKGSLNIRG